VALAKCVQVTATLVTTVPRTARRKASCTIADGSECSRKPASPDTMSAKAEGIPRT
jgi:hypothetical protein